MKTNIKFQQKAEQLIPGGNSLLSKRRQMFSPGMWPSFFSSTAGLIVEDLDGNAYKDFSHYSVGTCTLGYNNKEVNDVVKECIDKGVMSTLNCPEEVLLAEKLINMHPWAEMCRFARTGGEANALAVRIARAATKKDKIIIHGYHGWHDWYLSANLGDNEALDGHLLPGLAPLGVPKALRGTTIPMDVFNTEALKEELNRGDIAAVKMEVMRSRRPTRDEIYKIRKLCDEYNVLLIFDECTSGFREAFGGMHLNYQVYPDLCVLGKTIGNGYALTTVIGKGSVMKSSESSFISSTFWTERIGFVASLKTLEVMERERSWTAITETGKYYIDRVSSVAKKNSLKIRWSGMPALASYSLEYSSLEWNVIKTFITESLLNKGYLHACLFYPSLLHTREEVDLFVEALSDTFSELKSMSSTAITDSLIGEPCYNTFKRLN